MTVYIDGDGCPVVRLAVDIAGEYGIEVVLVSDTAHFFDIERAYVTCVTVSKGSDSADFAILSRCGRGDIVITQDYALAALCLAKGALPINQNGRRYTNDNIDSMLMTRHINRAARKAGIKTYKPHKRKKTDNDAFVRSFTELVANCLLTDN